MNRRFLTGIFSVVAVVLTAMLMSSEAEAGRRFCRPAACRPVMRCRPICQPVCTPAPTCCTPAPTCCAPAPSCCGGCGTASGCGAVSGCGAAGCAGAGCGAVMSESVVQESEGSPVVEAPAADEAPAEAPAADEAPAEAPAADEVPEAPAESASDANPEA